MSDLPVPDRTRAVVKSHSFAPDRRGRCSGCGEYRAGHTLAAKEAVVERHNENIRRYGDRSQTDLYTLDVTPAGGWESHQASAAAWWALKDEALREVTQDRRERGCDCEAPPWFSPPAEWPMKILLAHDPGCSTIRTPEGETVISLGRDSRSLPIRPGSPPVNPLERQLEGPLLRPPSSRVGRDGEAEEGSPGCARFVPGEEGRCGSCGEFWEHPNHKQEHRSRGAAS